MQKRVFLPFVALVALLALPTFAIAAIVYSKTSTLSLVTNPSMYTANDDGTGEALLPVKGREPIVSPNGATVAYSYVTNTKTWLTELRLLNLSTGVMVNTKKSCSNPFWSPDSTTVLCQTSSQTGADIKGFGLVAINTAGVASIIVPSVGYSISGYSWSPNSQQIVWSQSAWTDGKGLGRTVLRIGKPDGSGTPTKLGSGSTPLWGPSTIAFTRIDSSRAPGVSRWYHTQIWTVDPTSGASSAKVLTAYQAKGFVSGPTPFRWTPDGKNIVGSLSGEDYAQPIYVNATTGRIRMFGPSNAAPAAVAADGKSALVVTNVMGGGTQIAYVSPLGKVASSLILKNAGSVSATANWQP